MAVWGMMIYRWSISNLINRPQGIGEAITLPNKLQKVWNLYRLRTFLICSNVNLLIWDKMHLLFPFHFAPDNVIIYFKKDPQRATSLHSQMVSCSNLGLEIELKRKFISTSSRYMLHLQATCDDKIAEDVPSSTRYVSSPCWTTEYRFSPHKVVWSE